MPAQVSPATLPDLRLTRGGQVEAIAIQADGKVIVGGVFEAINGVARRNLVRLNPNGSVDLTWTTEADSVVSALVLQDSTLYVGGWFTEIGGRSRRYLAKLDTAKDGVVDPDWNPSVLSSSGFRPISSLVTDGTNLFVGGRYDQVAGLVRHGLAKLSGDGTGVVDPSWDPNPDGAVNELLLDGTSLYIGGSFQNIAGAARNHLARISALGSAMVDPIWAPNIASSEITSLALAFGFLYVGGDQSSTAGILVRLGATGVGIVDPLWQPLPTGRVRDLFLTGTNLYVGGDFGRIGGRFLLDLGKVSALGAGQADPGWDPSPNGSVLVLAGGEGSLFAGGIFTSLGANTSGETLAVGLVKIDEVTGTKDRSFPANAQMQGVVYTQVRQPDGKLVLGGDFLMSASLERRYLARMNLDGTLDLAWTPAVDGPVLAMGLAGADLFIGGTFFSIDHVRRSGLAKLSLSDGQLDPNWNPAPDAADHSRIGEINTLVVSDTNLFVGGIFSQIGGARRFNLAKLRTAGNGAADPIWDPNPVFLSDFRPFRALSIWGESLYVGGTFTNLGTSARRYLAKLSAGGGGLADALWNPQPDGTVDHVVASDVGLFVAGSFRQLGGQARSYLAKLNLGGGGEADPIWAPQPDWLVNALCLSGTNLFVGGYFSRIGGQNTSLAKLSTSGNGAADLTWVKPVQVNSSAGGFGSLFAYGTDLYAGAVFAGFGDGFSQRLGFAFLPVTEAPLITPDVVGLVVTPNPANGAEVTHFRVTGLDGVLLFQRGDGREVKVDDFFAADEGSAGLMYVGTGTVTMVSAVNDTPWGAGTAATRVNLTLPQPPVVRFAEANCSVKEGSGFVVVNVKKIGIGPASVSYSTTNGTAVSGADYQAKTGTINFAANETNKSITIAIVDDFDSEGDEVFGLTLTGSAGVGVVYPRTTTVTIIDNEAVGPTSSFTNNQLPSPVAPPHSSGVLVVTLNATNGQWRLAGDDAWHASGTAIGGLTGGFYELEFRRLLGYRDPQGRSARVEDARTNSELLEVYFQESTNGNGHLRVLILPAPVANNTDPSQRGGWRLQSQPENAWRDSGDTLFDLPAGYHSIVFKGVTNWAAPLPQEVRVVANQPNEIGEEYAPLPASAGLGPRVLSLTDATTTPPYLFNGQIRTPLGFGSGAVVKERVVLTAAHVLFDYRVLSFAPYWEVRWLWRKHKGDYEPLPQTPRGWYARDGYAALRQASATQDTSPELQHLDVAAMYFVANDTSTNLPGGGGYGGYLTSDDNANEWLILGDRLKMLVGYPLDGINVADRGKMHATTPTNASFTRLYLKVFGTPDLRSYGGNSGGPLYVQYDDGRYYPAGIYLGRSEQTLVRAIDSDVVDLINRAQDSGQGAGNHNGGGVVRWESGVTGSPWQPGLFRVNFAPSNTILAGAGWRVVGADDQTWIRDTNLYYPLIPGPFNIEFEPIAGYSAPAVRRVEVVVDQTTPIDALYSLISLSSPRSLPNGTFQFTLSGATNRVYTIEASSTLSTWLTVGTLTNGSGTSGTASVQFRDGVTNVNRRFYRARE